MYIVLTMSTLIAVLMCIGQYQGKAIDFRPILPVNTSEIVFLIAFMGWMPAPLDISVWHSLWAIEKKKTSEKMISTKSALLDFNIGYIATIIIGISFLLLGYFIMFNTGQTL